MKWQSRMAIRAGISVLRSAVMVAVLVLVASGIAACGGGGGSSAAVTPPPVVLPPATPTGLVATAGDGDARLQWNASANATGYVLTRAASPNSAYATVANLTSTAFHDTGLVNGTTYYYEVTAIDSAGSSAPSAPVPASPVATLQPPGGSPVLAASAGDARVSLTWTAVIGATRYSVERSADGGATFVPLATVADLGYLDTGLQNGSAYSYRVRGVNDAGAGPPSSPVAVTPVPAVQVPAVPSGLTAVPGDAVAHLSWMPDANATSYRVRRATATGGPYAVVGAPVGPGFNDTGLADGTTYFYGIAAVNAAGASAYSADIGVTPRQAAPGRPAAPTAVRGAAAVVLSWSTVPGADRYRVKRAGSSTGPFTVLGEAVKAPYLDTTAVAGTTYFYVVSALNSGGESADSPATPVLIPGPLVLVTAAVLPTATRGTAYTLGLAAQGGVSPYAWSVTAGSLPPGMTLRPGGRLSGTPGAPGLYAFSLTVTDADSPASVRQRTYTLPVLDGSAVVTVTPAQGPPLATLSGDFAGLSYEKSKLATALFSAADADMVALFHRLGPGLLRVGGNSVDHSRWLASGPGLQPGVIARADVDRFGGFLRATGWKVIYGIEFLDEATSPVGFADPAAVADEAVYAMKALGDRLAGFELGNEPDEYPGKVPGYTYPQFHARWLLYKRAIDQAIAAAKIGGTLPAGAVATYIGPATAIDDAAYTAPFARDEARHVELLTRHYYRGDGQSAASTMDFLLSPDPRLASVLTEMASIVGKNGIAGGFRLGEANSFYNGGAPGISDAFGSALWALDFLFANAAAGAQGVNFHGGGNPLGYTPITDNGTQPLIVRPVYYALDLFARAAVGDLVPVSVTGGSATLSVRAVRTATGFCIVLVNTSRTRAEDVVLLLPPALGQAEPFVLSGPSVDATTGTALNGAPIGSDGSWQPLAVPALPLSGGRLEVPVPAGSALLLRVN